MTSDNHSTNILDQQIVAEQNELLKQLNNNLIEQSRGLARELAAVKSKYEELQAQFRKLTAEKPFDVEDK